MKKSAVFCEAGALTFRNRDKALIDPKDLLPAMAQDRKCTENTVYFRRLSRASECEACTESKENHKSFGACTGLQRVLSRQSGP